MNAKLLLLALPLALSLNVRAAAIEQSNEMDELNPFAANIEEQLQAMDADYETSTGEAAFEEQLFSSEKNVDECYQRTCKIFLDVNKATQRAELFIDGALTYTWKVSTGTKSHGTPNMDTHPNGRIYNKYTSSKYPGGDYMGLGNMPYVVFIKGGFAVHGTGKSNWPKLGTRASHGCVRVHPDNAKIFNGLVREATVKKTWITVR